MSGSLARLVLRAQGRLPVAEPLLPSRFAPAGPASATTDPLAMEAEAEPVAPLPARAPPQPPTTPMAIEASAAVSPEQAQASPPAVSAHPAAAPAPRDRGTPFVPQPPQAQRAPAAQDATKAGAEPVAPLSSLSRADTVPGPARLPSQPPSTALGIEASTAVSPGRAQALPPAVSAHPTAAPWLAPAEQPELTAGIAASRPRPTAQNAQFEAESFQPASRRRWSIGAGFVPLPTERPRAADVLISIGRVEVHAAPARPAPGQAAPPRHPPRSLADYLAQQK